MNIILIVVISVVAKNTKSIFFLKMINKITRFTVIMHRLCYDSQIKSICNL